MKRAPGRNEPWILHRTTDTGDVQVFALCEESFSREALWEVGKLFEPPLPGREDVLAVRRSSGVLIEIRGIRCDRMLFAVIDASIGVALTMNHVQVTTSPLRIELMTTILMPVPDVELWAMLADLEQCAAIALANVHLDETQRATS